MVLNWIITNSINNISWVTDLLAMQKTLADLWLSGKTALAHWNPKDQASEEKVLWQQQILKLMCDWKTQKGKTNISTR